MMTASWVDRIVNDCAGHGSCTNNECRASSYDANGCTTKKLDWATTVVVMVVVVVVVVKHMECFE